MILDTINTPYAFLTRPRGASKTTDVAGTLVGLLEKVDAKRAVELMKSHVSMSRADAELKVYELDRDLEHATMHYAAIQPSEDAQAEIAKHDSDFADRVRTIVAEAE